MSVFSVKTIGALSKVVLDDPISAFCATFRYFSTWVLLLVVFHKYTHDFIDLYFISGIVFVLSMFVSYISPGYLNYEQNGNVYKIEGPLKVLIDVTIHILPFVFISLYYGQNIQSGLCLSNAMLIMLIYLILFDPKRVYNVGDKSVLMFLTYLVASVVFFTFARDGLRPV
jgi:hypothetical protein